MRRVILQRLSPSLVSPDGRFGQLRVVEEVPHTTTKTFCECFTVELPWKKDQPDISCVPTGNYPLLWE